MAILKRHITTLANPSNDILNESAIEFMLLPGMERFIRNYSKKSQATFMHYAILYMKLYLPNCGFSIEVTDRYFSKSGRNEACVIARRHYSAGEEIQFLEAWTARIEEEEFSQFKGPDFSMITHEDGSGSLLLGPARFVNHSCLANSTFKRRGKRISLVVTKPIAPGQEITVYYGKKYFGRYNRECLCLACEIRGVNGFGEPLVTSSSESSDDDEDEGVDVEEEEEEDPDALAQPKSNNGHSKKPDAKEISTNHANSKDTRRQLSSIIARTTTKLTTTSNTSSNSPSTDDSTSEENFASPSRSSPAGSDVDTPASSVSPDNEGSPPPKSTTVITTSHRSTFISSSITYPDRTESSTPPVTDQNSYSYRHHHLRSKDDMNKKVLKFVKFTFPDDDDNFTMTQIEYRREKIATSGLTLMDYICDKLGRFGMWIELQRLYYEAPIIAELDLTLDCINCGVPFFGPDDSIAPRILPNRFCPRCNQHAALYNSYWPSREKVDEVIELKRPWDFSYLQQLGCRGEYTEDDKAHKRKRAKSTATCNHPGHCNGYNCYKSSTEKSSPLSLDDATTEESRKGPGRPKKNQPTDDSVSAPAKKRGRPKLSNLIASSKNNVSDVVVVKRGRGRPKNPTKLSISTTISKTHAFQHDLDDDSSEGSDNETSDSENEQPNKSKQQRRSSTKVKVAETKKQATTNNTKSSKSAVKPTKTIVSLTKVTSTRKKGPIPKKIPSTKDLSPNETNDKNDSSEPEISKPPKAPLKNSSNQKNTSQAEETGNEDRSSDDEESSSEEESDIYDSDVGSDESVVMSGPGFYISIPKTAAEVRADAAAKVKKKEEKAQRKKDKATSKKDQVKGGSKKNGANKIVKDKDPKSIKLEVDDKAITTTGKSRSDSRKNITRINEDNVEISSKEHAEKHLIVPTSRRRTRSSSVSLTSSSSNPTRNLLSNSQKPIEPLSSKKSKSPVRSSSPIPIQVQKNTTEISLEDEDDDDDLLEIISFPNGSHSPVYTRMVPSKSLSTNFQQQPNSSDGASRKRVHDDSQDIKTDYNSKKQRSFGASHSYDRKPNSKTQFVKRESNTGHDVIYIDSDNDEEEDENDPVDMRVTPYVRRYSVLSSLYGNSYQGRYDNSSKSNIDSSPPSIYVPTINPIRPALRNTSYLALLRHQEELRNAQNQRLLIDSDNEDQSSSSDEDQGGLSLPGMSAAERLNQIDTQSDSDDDDDDDDDNDNDNDDEYDNDEEYSSQQKRDAGPYQQFPNRVSQALNRPHTSPHSYKTNQERINRPSSQQHDQQKGPRIKNFVPMSNFTYHQRSSQRQPSWRLVQKLS